MQRLSLKPEEQVLLMNWRIPEWRIRNRSGKRGEVALEQFHITRLIHPAFNVRAGHLIVPVGLTNEHHEPINFFGTSRPEGETTILLQPGMKTVSRCLVRLVGSMSVLIISFKSLPD